MHILRSEFDRKMKEVEQKMKALRAQGGLSEGSDLYRKLLKMIAEKASIYDVG